MTTFATTEPPLKRLFERLDFAPRPSRQELALVLEQWRAARGGAIAPPLEAVAEPSGRASEVIFAYRLQGERDYVLVEGEAAVEPLLGRSRAGARLSEAEGRRGAVRLRRLFQQACRAGEPVLAEFTLVERGRDRAQVELLAAPLSEDGRAIDGVMGAFSIRDFEAAAPAHSARDTKADGFSLFALGASRSFGEMAAHSIGVELSRHEEREFEDGEHKTRPLVNVRDCDVYVIHSLHGDESQSGADKLLRLLFFIGALRDAGAARISAVVPYLCYARKDRQTKARDPVATRYVAQLFEAVGTDRVMVLDVHNVAAFQNAFRCDVETLDAHAVLARRLISEIGDEPLAVVSPDLGGEKRAELFRQRMERLLGRPVAKGFMDKHRSMGRVTGEIFAGDVDGRTVVILDDLISTGGTMARTASACRNNGASRVLLVATHGLFSSGAEAVLREAPVDKIIVTDTVPLPRHMGSESFEDRLQIVSVSELVAQAIWRCHTGGSIVELLEEGP